MKIKTVQWNIGGGKVLAEGADPTRLSSYCDEGMPQIIEQLGELNPDIITLQETHAAGGYSQPKMIAEALGYPSWVNNEFADSHVEAGYRLGQAVVSRFPLKMRGFSWFINPNWEKERWEGGAATAKSHDKGVTRCVAQVEDIGPLIVKTCHTVPFRRFDIPIESAEAKQVLHDMSEKIIGVDDGRTAEIVQSDVNINAVSLRRALPALFRAGFAEVLQKEATTPKGHHLDHVVYRGGPQVVGSVTLDNVLTDHYPVVTEFELK